jgi:hypothetical protein
MAHCVKKQQDYREKLIKQQEAFSSFEKVIMQNIKGIDSITQVSLSTFYEFRSTQFAQQFDLAKDIGQRMESFNADEDWQKFRAENMERLLDPKASLVQIKDVVYDGCDDISIKSIKEGTLLRKEGVIVKTYKQLHCVLTQAGFFHVMPPLSGEFPEAPELSLDLSDCTLQPLMMNEKEPEEIAFIEKSKGMFSSEVKHKVFCF